MSVGCDDENFSSPKESCGASACRGEANLSLFHFIVKMQQEGRIKFTQLILEGDGRWIHISYVPSDLRCQVIA